MTALLALLRAELLLHRRSVRSRLALFLYPLLTLAPWPLFKSQLAGSDLVVGPATAFAMISAILPYSTLLLAAGLAGRGADRAAREELLPLLAGSPFSSSAVVAGRALVLALLFFMATALPFLALFALGTAGGDHPPDGLALLLGWLLRAWPMALAMGWTWLALALIGGSDLAAGLLLGLGSLLLDQLRQLAGSWETSFGWPFFTSPHYFQQLAAVVFDHQRRDDFWWILPGLVASEGPADPLLVLRRALIDFTPALGLAAVLLAIAAQRLGRCRADLRPRDFSQVPSLGRLRQFLAFDGGLGRAEKALAWLALVPAGAALFLVEREARAFFAWGEERYEAEKNDLGPATDPSLALQGIELRADLGDAASFPTGQLRASFRERFKSRGAGGQTQLAFRLDPRLALGQLVAEVDGVPVGAAIRRRHDRLWLELERPLPPGATLLIAGELAGRPASPQLGVVSFYATGSFLASWEALQRDPQSRRATRFAATDLHPAISRNQVRLAAWQLMPLPRYTPWQTPADEGQPLGAGDPEGDSTPEEESREPAPIEIELWAPAGWRLFDTCGAASRNVDGRSRLAGSCPARPADYAVRGGSLVVQDSGAVALATLPQHAAAAQPLLEALAGIHALSEKSWPGAPPLGKVVLVEDLKYFEPAALQIGNSGYFGESPPLRAQGSLLELSEKQLIFPSRFDPLQLAGPLLADRLLASRRLAPADSWVIGTFVRETVNARLGLRPRQAILGGAIWNREAYSQPLESYRRRESSSGIRRLAALVADLGGRLGSDALQLGLTDFLAGGAAGADEKPGTLEDLLAALEQRSGQSLAQFRADFLDRGGLPELALAEVRSQGQASGEFTVKGLLRNQGQGEVICPVVLRTDRGELWQKVRVGGRAATPFTFATAQRPILVELDPGATCLRFVPGGAPPPEKVQL